MKAGLDASFQGSAKPTGAGVNSHPEPAFPMPHSAVDQPPLSSPSEACYRFGGSLVASALPFRELPAGAQQPDEAVIRIQACRQVERFLPLPDPAWELGASGDGDVEPMVMARLDGRHLLRFHGLCEFELDFGQRSIAIRCLPGLDDNTLEHLLVDQVLPRFLAHEGDLLLHACAVVIAGRTVLILGESGWGKSTLAALMRRAGHELLSDDCVHIRSRGDGFVALPTYPSLRLFADSLDQVFPDAIGATAVAGYSGKRRLPMPSPEAAAIGSEIAALYLLDEPSDNYPDLEIRPMRPVSACLELMRHSFKLDIEDRLRTQRLFAACSDLARAVPAFSLDYPRDYRRSQPLVQGIAGHVAGLPVRASTALATGVPNARR